MDAVRTLSVKERVGTVTAPQERAGSLAHWHLQDALASGVRVKILLRMRAHPDKVYAAAREAAHSADEWQRVAAAYEIEG